MPDISILPTLSEVFSVSIDDLFDLADDQKMRRIENRMQTDDDIAPELFQEYETFLKEQKDKDNSEPNAINLLARLYHHKMETYGRKAGLYARKAISRSQNRPILHYHTIAQHTDCDSWTDEMWGEALAILDTMQFDEEKTEGGVGQSNPGSNDDTIAVQMRVSHITPTGLTVHFTQYDKRDCGELIYGECTVQFQDGK
ncbi:MAG: hypothetical protein J6X66_02895 [Lachnospiraceae bacterium]|nr:hypothetical protein [Lachnospiraceae bacterium]